MLKIKIGFATLFFSLCLQFFSFSLRAQQQYGSLSDALQAGFRLHGKSGPRSVNWINGGDEYSFIGCCIQY